MVDQFIETKTLLGSGCLWWSACKRAFSSALYRRIWSRSTLRLSKSSPAVFSKSEEEDCEGDGSFAQLGDDTSMLAELATAPFSLLSESATAPLIRVTLHFSPPHFYHIVVPEFQREPGVFGSYYLAKQEQQRRGTSVWFDRLSGNIKWGAARNSVGRQTGRTTLVKQNTPNYLWENKQTDISRYGPRSPNNLIPLQYKQPSRKQTNTKQKYN